MPKALAAFEAYGIEAEYMIVDKETLAVKPIADFILKKLNNGKLIDEVEVGEVAWSNELVCHVIELKCNGPKKNIDSFDQVFHSAILHINQILTEVGACLMPTAMHPWMNVDTETKLWPFGQKDIYAAYDKIFSCKGHGWSNLQSVHINLAFKDENEFSKLYNCVRFVLPFIPWLSASSPFYEAKQGLAADNRLNFYEKNQARVASIAGKVIPEYLSSFEGYDQLLESIYKEIGPLDPEKTLQHSWLNSRGAIAKMDVQAIEIRLMDIQESPYMDFSLIHFYIAFLKKLYQNFSKIDFQKESIQTALIEVYQMSKGYNSFELPKVLFEELAHVFPVKSQDINESLRTIFMDLKPNIPAHYHGGIDKIISDGNLAKRLLKSSSALSKAQYMKLIKSLKENSIYD